VISKIFKRLFTFIRENPGTCAGTLGLAVLVFGPAQYPELASGAFGVLAFVLGTIGAVIQAITPAYSTIQPLVDEHAIPLFTALVLVPCAAVSLYAAYELAVLLFDYTVVLLVTGETDTLSDSNRSKPGDADYMWWFGNWSKRRWERKQANKE